MMRIETFDERYEYLKLKGVVGESTFGSTRHLNQAFYTSKKWRSVRDTIIIRDGACDLGIGDREIHDMVIVHHINPITSEDLELDRFILYDPENLVCVSDRTHNAIHFGDSNLLAKDPVIRRPNDTTPWK